MARMGKITIYLDEGSHSSTLSVRTTGRMGSVPLNTLSLNLDYNYAISGADAEAVWKTVTSLVTGAIP